MNNYVHLCVNGAAGSWGGVMIYDITAKMSKHRYPEPRSYEKSWLPLEIKDPAACKKGWKAGTTEKAQIRMQREFEKCRALLIQGD